MASTQIEGSVLYLCLNIQRGRLDRFFQLGRVARKFQFDVGCHDGRSWVRGEVPILIHGCLVLEVNVAMNILGSGGKSDFWRSVQLLVSNQFAVQPTSIDCYEQGLKAHIDIAIGCSRRDLRCRSRVAGADTCRCKAHPPQLPLALSDDEDDEDDDWLCSLELFEEAMLKLI